MLDAERRRAFVHRLQADGTYGSSPPRALQPMWPAAVATPIIDNVGNTTGREARLPAPHYAPEEVAHAILHAAEHPLFRGFLQRRFREIGIGVAVSTPGGSYSVGATYTTTFGARTGAPQSVVARSNVRRSSRLIMRVGPQAHHSRAATFRQAR